MKKILFPVVLISIFILSACKGTTAPTAASSAGTTNEKTEITFSMWGAPEELTVWKQIVADFEAENPNITVNVEVSDWDSYWDKLKTQLAAGTPPDVFAMDAPLYLDYQSRGVLLNLTPYLDKNPDMLKDVYPQTLAAYQTPDGYFGLPRDFQTILLFYNKDMFDAAGIAYPDDTWTWDDLRTAAKKLTKPADANGKKQYGFIFDQWDMETGWSEAIWSYGGDIISADHKKTLIGEDKARQAWQLLYDMVFVDKSVPNADEISQYGGDLFQSGIAAMTPMGHWSVPGYTQSGINFGVAPMPKGPAGRVTSVNSAGFVIAKASKNPDAAFEFVKFALSEKGQTRLAQLGFACPVLKSVAESSAFLQQSGSTIDQKLFLDAISYSHMKPVFKGYDEWSSAVGDGLDPVWRGEADLNTTLNDIVTQANAILAKN